LPLTGSTCHYTKETKTDSDEIQNDPLTSKSAHLLNDKNRLILGVKVNNPRRLPTLLLAMLNPAPFHVLCRLPT
jgi:hypothetical protein